MVGLPQPQRPEGGASCPTPRRTPVLCCWWPTTVSLSTWAAGRRAPPSTTWSVAPSRRLPVGASRPEDRRFKRLCPQIELIDRVDDIYRNTSWDEDFSGYGVQIQQVRGGAGGRRRVGCELLVSPLRSSSRRTRLPSAREEATSTWGEARRRAEGSGT